MSGHAFISYVREDSKAVERLWRALEAAEIPVWRDTTDIRLGLDWRDEIRQAITEDALVVIACFSDSSEAREKTVQREELTLAVEQYQQRPQDRAWLIPVRLSDCQIPKIDLGGGKTLDRLNRLDLFGDQWDESCARLVDEISWMLEGLEEQQPSPDEPGSDLPDGPSGGQLGETSAFDADLSRARRRLAELEAALDEAVQLVEKAVRRVAGFRPGPLPDLDELAAGLAKIEAAGSHAAGGTESKQFGSWRGAWSAARRQVQETREAADSELRRQDHLRGYLGTQEDKANKRGWRERQQAEALLYEAKQMLWTEQCDLAAAEELLLRLAALLNQPPEDADA
jgi:hypothetical protein